MEMNVRKCGNCRYAVDCDGCGVELQCRRLPPASISVLLFAQQQNKHIKECGIWPHVSDEDWCGEFELANP